MTPRVGDPGLSVSVIVVSYFTGPCLGECLGALASAERVGEIVVVDNGNDPAGEQVIESFAAQVDRVRVLRGQGNVGFAAACNMGARQAAGEMLVFVNPDVILSPDAVARLCAALDEAPKPAIIGGDLRNEHGAPDRGSRRDHLTLWRAFVSVAGLSRFEGVIALLRDYNRRGDPLPLAPTQVGAISGALFAVRKADFESIGGFDEGYFLHFEDIDLCRRAENAGWAVLFAPGPHGVHVRSTSDVSAHEVRRHKARSAARYFVKHASGMVERILARAVGGILLLIAR